MQLPRTSCRSSDSDSDTDSLIALHNMLSAFGWKQFSLIGFGIIGGGERRQREKVERDSMFGRVVVVQVVQVYSLLSKLRGGCDCETFTLELTVRCVVDST